MENSHHQSRRQATIIMSAGMSLRPFFTDSSRMQNIPKFFRDRALYDYLRRDNCQKEAQ